MLHFSHKQKSTFRLVLCFCLYFCVIKIYTNFGVKVLTVYSFNLISIDCSILLCTLTFAFICTDFPFGEISDQKRKNRLDKISVKLSLRPESIKSPKKRESKKWKKMKEPKPEMIEMQTLKSRPEPRPTSSGYETSTTPFRT